MCDGKQPFNIFIIGYLSLIIWCAIKFKGWSFTEMPTRLLTFKSLAPTSQNGQTGSNNSSAVADELFECVRPFCGVVA